MASCGHLRSKAGNVRLRLGFIAFVHLVVLVISSSVFANCSAVVAGVTIPNREAKLFPAVHPLQAAPDGGSDAFVARITPYDAPAETANHRWNRFRSRLP
jgi:hypothetical protein